MLGDGGLGIAREDQEPVKDSDRLYVVAESGVSEHLGTPFRNLRMPAHPTNHDFTFYWIPVKIDAHTL